MVLFPPPRLGRGFIGSCISSRSCCSSSSATAFHNIHNGWSVSFEPIITKGALRMSEAQMKVSDEIAISIEHMNKWYGTFHVLRDINLDVQRGERIVICGPSGSYEQQHKRRLGFLHPSLQGNQHPPQIQRVLLTIPQ